MNKRLIIGQNITISSMLQAILWLLRADHYEIFKTTNIKLKTKLIERDIYGSSRLGTDNAPIIQTSYYNATFPIGPGPFPFPGNPLPGLVTVLAQQDVIFAGSGVVGIVDPTLANLQVAITATTTAVFIGIPGGTLGETRLTFDGVNDFALAATSFTDVIAAGDFTFEALIKANEADAGNHPVILCNRTFSPSLSGMKFFFHNIHSGSLVKMLGSTVRWSELFCGR